MSSKSILSVLIRESGLHFTMLAVMSLVLIREGGVHFTLLAGMSLVLISKECMYVCLCMLGIYTVFRLPDFKHDSAVVFVSINLCHMLLWLHVFTRYSPYQFSR